MHHPLNTGPEEHFNNANLTNRIIAVIKPLRKVFNHKRLLSRVKLKSELIS